MKRHSPTPLIDTSDARISVRDVFYVSNLLSLARMGLIPFIFLSIIHHHRLLTLVLGSLAVVSDALDGYFARRLNQHSNLGKVLDPIADKGAIGAVILALIVSKRDFPLWAFGIVIARDVLIVIAGIILFRQTRIIARSDLWGKCTTFFLSIALLLYVLELQSPLPPPLPFYILCIGLVFALISSWSYSRRLVRMLQQSEPPHKK